MKHHISLLVALLLTLILLLSGCGKDQVPDVDLNNINLNSLTEEEYKAFNRVIYHEYQNNPQLVGEQAKQIIIGMAGLENRPEAHGVFEIDVNFNVNAMLLLVANANRIKREPTFIDEFRRQITNTRPMLTTVDQRTYFDVFTTLLLSEHNKL